MFKLELQTKALESEKRAKKKPPKNCVYPPLFKMGDSFFRI